MKHGPTQTFLAVLRHCAALLVLLALGLLFYEPPTAAQGFTYFGIGEDPFAFIWFLNWWPFAVLHHLPLFYTHYVDAPVGTELAWKAGIIGLGLFCAPLVAKFGALAVYNILMLTAPGLAGWGAYLVAAEITGDTAAALAGGVIFGFSSYMLGQLLEHLNLSFVFAVPFCLWAGIAAAKHRWSHWKLAAISGAALAFEFGVSQEIFASMVIFALITCAVLYTLHPAGRPALHRLAPGMALGLCISLVIVSPVIWAMLRALHDAGHVIASPAAYSTDLLGLILPTPTDWVGGRWLQPVTQKLAGNYSEEGGYIGLPLLLLLASVGWRRRADPVFSVPGIVALAACILSFGPYLHVCGVEVSTAPWLLAFRLPFLSAILPARLMLYAWLAIAILLAIWLAEPGAKFPRYAVLVLCLVFLVPARAYDRNWTRLEIPPALTNGSIAPGTSLVILPETDAEMAYQYASGMRFSLAGQGYLSNGSPLPFAAWPLYRALFTQKYAPYMPLINPQMLAAYLAAYHVQGVLITPDAGGMAVADQAEAAAGLLQKAGWRQVPAGTGNELFRAPVPQVTPSAAQIAAYLHMPAPEAEGLRLKHEISWVCGILRIARSTGVNPAAPLAYYAAHAHPPLPPSAITCGKP